MMPDSHAAIRLKPVVGRSAIAMRNARRAAYEHGFSQLTVYLPVSLIHRLDSLKKRYDLKNRHAVANAVIAKARHSLDVQSIQLPRIASEELRRISVNLLPDHRAYLEDLTRCLRGATMSLTVEAIVAAISDIAPDPVQLSLIQGDETVHGT